MALVKNLFRSCVNLAVLVSLQLERFVEVQMSIQRQTRNIFQLHYVYLCLQTVIRTLQT